MTAPIEAQLDRVRRHCKLAKLELLEISGSFRVYLNCGEHAYIHPETYENQIAVSVETGEPDLIRRTGMLVRIREELAKVLGFARIGVFGLVCQTRTKWIYTAQLHITAAECPQLGKGQEPQGTEAPLVPCPASSSPADIAVEDLQELLGMLDRHRLEQQLDWMYVSGESPVRKALHALMRGKTDAERLEGVIEEQSRILAATDKAHELELICRINPDIVLQPILDYICAMVEALRCG